MASSNVCWGIEAGAGAIKALRLEIQNGEPVITDFAVIPHAKVLSTPGLDQDDAMRVALGTLAAQYDLSKATIACSVPGHAALARFAKLPPVEPKKVPDIVKFEAAQQIPFPLEEVEWDYQTFQSPDSPEVEVGIFAIPKARIAAQLQMLADVGLTPDVVNLSPVAVYNALAYDLKFTERTPGTIILDIGTTSTDLIIAESGRVWVRTFQIGGHNFTEALVNQFKLGYPKAERLKREADQTKHAKHVFQAMRGVFTDLAQEVQRSVGSYQSRHSDVKLTRLIGIGATFELPGLRKFLKQQLGVEVYRLEEFKRTSLAGEQKGRKDELEQNALRLTTAYGLALQGLGYETIEANLIPVANIREAMWKKKVPYFGLAAGLAVFASAAMFSRWFLDSNAYGNLRPPAAIQEAASRAQDLTGRAQEAQVLGGAEPDYTAANIIALLEDKGIYQHLMTDIGELVNDIDSRVRDGQFGPSVSGDETAFELVGMETNFVRTNLRVSGFLTAAPTADRGRRGRGQEDPGVGQPDAPEEPHTDKRRVIVQVQVATDHEDPRRVIVEGVLRWLREHERREGRPYRIWSDADWVVQTGSIREIEVAQARTPPRQEDPLRDLGRGPAGGGEGTGVGSGGGVGEGGPGGGGAGDTPAQIAPLTPPSSEARIGRSRAVVQFVLVLGDEEEEAGETDPFGGA
ncbi:MAG: type IV pilus assembly protein PilM [Phycisphaerales bacterium]|nr:type IV pilus assembly protein PilM [Phycisphaerales bacterium]